LKAQNAIEQQKKYILMTYSTPRCPMGESIIFEAKQTLQETSGNMIPF
jgi:metal-sulfur cluster biosynthetic enzyme